jgi:HPt (histidine-containing phosphotransfer) domain-containing protein
MSGAPLIDRAVLDELVDAIGADGVRSVLDLFIAESRRYLDAIAAGAMPGAGAEQRDGARRAAHSLKSGAGQIGAAALAAAAEAVERAVETGSADLGQVTSALRERAAETLAALAVVRRSYPVMVSNG